MAADATPDGESDPDDVARALDELRLAEARLDRRRRRLVDSPRDRDATRYLLDRADRGDEATPHELAEHLGVARPTVSDVLARLIDAGVVVARPHPADGRSKVLGPADRRDPDEPITDEFHTILSSLTDEQSATLRQLLEDLRIVVDRSLPD